MPNSTGNKNGECDPELHQTHYSISVTSISSEFKKI